jgi:hypothetical protein
VYQDGTYETVPYIAILIAVILLSSENHLWSLLGYKLELYFQRPSAECPVTCKGSQLRLDRLAQLASRCNWLWQPTIKRRPISILLHEAAAQDSPSYPSIVSYVASDHVRCNSTSMSSQSGPSNVGQSITPRLRYKLIYFSHDLCSKNNALTLREKASQRHRTRFM